MCGLTALIGPAGSVSTETLAAIQRVLRHRGPDSEGVVLFRGENSEPVILGHEDTPRGIYAAAGAGRLA